MVAFFVGVLRYYCGMKRDHLIPKSIVDKNGHKRTVKVKPNGGNAIVTPIRGGSVPPTPAREAVSLAERIKDSDVELKRSVAAHPSLSAEIAEELAKSSDFDVLKNLAENPRTPLHILEGLAQRNTVNLSVVDNPSSSLRILRSVKNMNAFDSASHDAFSAIEDRFPQLKDAETEEDRERIAGDPNATPYELADLSRDASLRVRQAVADNPSTPMYVLNNMPA